MLNRRDHPDYQCDRVEWAADVVRRVDKRSVRVLFDVYHVQVSEGNVIARFREQHDTIGHVHTAGVPGRRDLDSGPGAQLSGDRARHRVRWLRRVDRSRARAEGRSDRVLGLDLRTGAQRPGRGLVRALHFAGNDVVDLVDVADPEPSSQTAMIRVAFSALCGSERRALREGHSLNSGHEACGHVVTAPSGSRLHVGELVGISAVTGCGSCPSCSAGDEVRCATPGVLTGMHAELVAAPLSSLRRLPTTATVEDAVLLTGDSLGVPVRGCAAAPHRPGEHVVVIGLGPVGLATVLVRSHLGARVTGIEPSATRRELAAQLGATATFEPGHDIGERASVVVEASGRAECVALAMRIAERGGTVVQSAECELAEISPSTVMLKELTYVGSWYYSSSDLQRVFEMFSDGLPVRKLVTDVVAPADAPQAYIKFFGGIGGKVLIDWR